MRAEDLGALVTDRAEREARGELVWSVLDDVTGGVVDIIPTEEGKRIIEDAYFERYGFRLGS